MNLFRPCRRSFVWFCIVVPDESVQQDLVVPAERGDSRWHAGCVGASKEDTGLLPQPDAC